MSYDYFNKTSGLTSADILGNPGYQKWFLDLEGTISEFGDSTGTYMKDMVAFGPSRYDMVLVYEAVAIENAANAIGRYGELRVYYPPTTLISDHPFCVLSADWVTPEKAQAAQVLLDYLSGEDAQRTAMLKYGYRPVNPAVALDEPGSPFSQFATMGVEARIPSVILTAPPGDVLNTLLDFWSRNVARLDRRSVMKRGLVNALSILACVSWVLTSCGVVQNLTRPKVTVSIVYGSEKQEWLIPLVDQFNRENHETPDGDTIEIEATAMGSIESVRGIIDGTIQPTVWSPASSVYIPVANAEWHKTHADDLVVGTPDDLVLSSVVIATVAADGPGPRLAGHPDRLGRDRPAGDFDGRMVVYGYPEVESQVRSHPPRLQQQRCGLHHRPGLCRGAEAAWPDVG